MNCSVLRQRLSCRPISRRCYHELLYKQNGQPLDVLEYQEKPQIPNSTCKTGNGSVLVEIIAAPWNPADVNAVQGRYADPYKLPNSLTTIDSTRIRQSYISENATVPGSEGVGRVLDVNNNNNTDLTVGDHVVLGLPGLGTLRSHAWLPETALLKIPPNLFGNDDNNNAVAAAYFQVAGTAYRMITDFMANLRPGDVVVQNAANSSVGTMVAQLLPLLVKNIANNNDEPVTLINIVRRGSRTDEQYKALADSMSSSLNINIIVAAEEDLNDKEYFKEWQSSVLPMQKPKLALNAVGGDSASRLWKLLQPQDGVMVTYGGMSMQPVTLNTPSLIFQDKICRGYWHSAWMASHSKRERQEIVDQLVRYAADGAVKGPKVKSFELRDWQDALQYDKGQSSASERKKIVFSTTHDK